MSRLDKAKFNAAFARQKAESGIRDGGEQDPAVQELWAMIEPALEEKGQYEAEHREHLRETTEDIRSWRRARSFATFFSVSIVIVMLIAIYRVIGGYGPVSFANIGGDGVKIAFITATFGVVFGLTALMLRGAFTGSRRDEGPVLPEGARTAVEVLQALFLPKN